MPEGFSTDSYPKPSLKTATDYAQQYNTIAQQNQALQSGAIGIDKQKLDLMNTQFGLMNQELSSMSDNPNITKDQAAERLKRFADTYKMPPEVVNHMMGELSEAPNVKSFSDNALRRGMTVQERLNRMYGTPSTTSDAANTYQGVTASPAAGGGFTPSTKLPVQLPPGTGVTDPTTLQPGIVAPSGPAGVQPAAAVPMPRPAPAGLRGAVAPQVSGPTGPTIDRTPETPTTFDNRFAGAYPNTIPSGAAPGQAAAMQAVGEQSGKDYATDLSRAKNFQADIYPMQRVLDIVHEEGPQAFGPGTDSLNKFKNLAATWLPNVDQKTIDSISNKEQAKKYMIQAARTNGNTGTNDQLAASFDANPNTTMNTATIEAVMKSNIALRRMQNAQTLLFGKQGLPPSEYSKWISENQNVLDPRAFGFDIMDDNAKNKLMSSLAHKDSGSGDWVANKGKEKEFRKFENSLTFANSAGLIEPPGRR